MSQWLTIGISGITCGGKTTLAHTLRDYFITKQKTQLGNSSYILSDVQLISQDDYFLPVHDARHTWVEQLNAINFELLSSLDMKRMLLDIAWLTKGQLCVTRGSDYESRNCMEDHNDIYRIAKTTIPTPSVQQISNGNCAHTKPLITIKSNSFNHKYQSLCQQQRINDFPSPATILRINSQMNPQLDDNKISILIIEGFLIFKEPELLKMCDIKLHVHLPYEKCFERRQKRTYDPPDVAGYFEMCVWPYYENYFAEFRNRKDINFLNGEISKEKIFQHTLQRIYQCLEERCDVASCPPPYKFLGIPSSHNNNNKTFTVSCSTNINKSEK